VKLALPLLTVLTTVAVATAPAPAVILKHSIPRNTSPPTGALANTGWQYQAQFAGFLGTPISSKYFITAQHIGGVVGQDVAYQGVQYFTDQAVDVPGTDLRLWRISGTFPSWAPMWTPSDGTEVGKKLTVFGRGTQRGAPIIAPSVGLPDNSDQPAGSGGSFPGGIANSEVVPAGYEIRGWKWGVDDRVQSWGENVVKLNTNISGLGTLLYFTFDSSGGPNEAALSAGDSGGGVFVRNAGGQYKLAGINFGVDGPFRARMDEPGYFAAMLDFGGFYIDDPPQFTPPTMADIPAGAYASSIVANRAFINSVLATAATSGIPEPATAAIIGFIVPLMLARQPRPVLRQSR
jgi:hypothetical protein